MIYSKINHFFFAMYISIAGEFFFTGLRAIIH